jgi:serine/threonine protein kinase/WD40 repeat protein
MHRPPRAVAALAILARQGGFATLRSAAMLDSDALESRIAGRIGLSGVERRRFRGPPPRVPDHALLARIGGGSYGDVWLARTVTGQFRATKVVWRRNFSSDRPYEREFRGIVQFEPISRSHPGVVNILHVGRDDAVGCFFYVMELADNANAGGPGSAEGALLSSSPNPNYVPRTLAADLMASGRLSVSKALTLGVQLADALGHLHRHGLVHRDVKPSNVIFVEGQAKLADIGLITGVDEARSFVGTEGFIPPEGPGTAQADLFGLGRLLYEAVTGKDRCEFPDLPDDLNRWEDRTQFLELNEILSRACAPHPRHRHANAAELAGDLNLLLSGRSVRHAYGIESRLRLVTRIAVGTALTALLAVTGIWFQKAQREGADARTRHEVNLRARAERAEQQSLERLRESFLQQARAFTTSSEPDSRAQALEALRQAASIRPGLDLRNAALAALATPEMRILRRWHSGADRSMNQQPDTRLRRYSRPNPDGTVSILAIEDDAELVRLPSVHVPFDYGTFSPDGAWYAVKYRNQELRVWHLAAGTNFLAAPSVQDFVFAADSSQIAFVESETYLQASRLQTGEAAWRVATPFPVDRLVAHPLEPLFLVLEEGRSELHFRRWADGTIDRTFVLPKLGWIARWSADGANLITAHRDFSLHVWGWPSLTGPRLILPFHRSDPIWLETDPSGRWLATAAWDNQLALFDLRDGRLLFSRTGTSVHAAADRQVYLLANGIDWSLVEFDPAFAFQAITLHDEHKSPRDLAFSSDGRWIATSGQDGIRLLDRNHHEVHRLMTNEMSHRIVFHPSSHTLLSVTPNGVRAWEIRTDPLTDKTIYKPLALPADGRALFANVDVSLTGLSQDGKWWLSAAPEPTTRSRFWIRGTFDSIDREFLAPVTPNSHLPDFSADGRWLAWGSWRGRDAYVLALGMNPPPPLVRLDSTGSTSVAFSPNNQLLAVGGSTEIRFLQTGTWQQLHSVPRQPQGQLPPAVAFTADSRLCAIVLPPNRILLVDATTGAELALLPARSYFPVKAAFSPDQRSLAAVSTDHHLLIWELDQLRSKLGELGLDW